MNQKLSVTQPSSNQLETVQPQTRSWMRENLPPTVDPDRYEKGVAFMKSKDDGVKLWPNQIKMVLTDSVPISRMIDDPDKGGDTPIYVFANTFALKIRQFCSDAKIAPPENSVLLEKAIGAVVDNRWLTVIDILFFGRSLQKGGFKTAANENAAYPKHFQNFTESWLNECLEIYRTAKNEALAAAVKESERQERLWQPSGQPNPDVQDEILRLTWERMVKMNEIENPTPTVEPPPPIPTLADQQIFERYILPELEKGDRIKAAAMRNQHKRKGLAVWVLIDEYMKMAFEESYEGYKELTTQDPQALAEFYAEIAKQKNGQKTLDGIHLAFNDLQDENL